MGQKYNIVAQTALGTTVIHTYHSTLDYWYGTLSTHRNSYNSKNKTPSVGKYSLTILRKMKNSAHYGTQVIDTRFFQIEACNPWWFIFSNHCSDARTGDLQWKPKNNSGNFTWQQNILKNAPPQTLLNIDCSDGKYDFFHNTAAKIESA